MIALLTMVVSSTVTFADTVEVNSPSDAINGVVWIRGAAGSSGWSGTGFAIVWVTKYEYEKICVIGWLARPDINKYDSLSHRL